jgi:uncharacterized protein YoxC
MSIFKYILSPFVEFKEPDSKTPAKPDSPVAAKLASSQINNVQTSYKTSSDTSYSSNAEGEFAGYFEHLIDEANQKSPIFQGTDLKEYMDTKVELDSIPDEATKIKTAFNVLKRTGLTKDKLLSTGLEYIKLIEHELAGIEGAFAQQYKNDVQLKEQQLQVKAQEIQELTSKINAIHQEITQLSEQVAQSKQQLNNNKTQFITAGQRKKSELEAELNKINQYL